MLTLQFSQPGNTNPPVKLPPPPPDRCYACGARAIGTSRGVARVEAACIEHADTFRGTAGAS